MRYFRSARSVIARPADNTAYAAGDEVSNHATAGSVVRATLDMTGFTRGWILGAQIDLTPASGNFINTASDFELSVWKSASSVLPAAVGDNVTHPIVANVMQDHVALFRFDDAAWMGQLGAVAGTVTSVYQRVNAHVVNPLATPGLQQPYTFGFPFDFTGQKITERQFTFIIRALAAWTPTGVINTFGIVLDIEAE